MNEHIKIARAAFERGILDFEDMPNADRREFIAAWIGENADERMLAASPIMDLARKGYTDESADPREICEKIGRAVCDRLAILAIQSFSALAKIHIKHER